MTRRGMPVSVAARVLRMRGCSAWSLALLLLACAPRAASPLLAPCGDAAACAATQAAPYAGDAAPYTGRQLASTRGPAMRLSLPDHEQYPRFGAAVSSSRRRQQRAAARSVSAAAPGGGSVLLEVPAWPGGAPAALALTFDDGTPQQLAAIPPLCASLNATCTLFLSGPFAGSVTWRDVDERLSAANTAERIRAAAVAAWAPKDGYAAALDAFRAAGHELGAHTLYHKEACATSAPPEPPWWAFEPDMDDFDAVLRQHLGVWPRDVATFAYPFGALCAAARAVGRGRYLAMRTTRCDAVDSGAEDWTTAVPACELHPDGAAALKRARYTALASRALVVTYAHGVADDTAAGDAGWRAVSPAFITAALVPFVRDGFWLCGFAQCVRHLRMRECVTVAPVPPSNGTHDDDDDGGPVSGVPPATAYVDATACDVALQSWTLCGRWVGAAAPATPPLLAWWGGAPLRPEAGATAGPNSVCWRLPRGRGDVTVLSVTTAQ